MKKLLQFIYFFWGKDFCIFGLNTNLNLMKEIVLKEFDESKLKFFDFKDKMELLIGELLKSESITVHQINGRVKERVSLEKKIERKNNKYNNISELTDVIGIRIITYLESDVDKVAKILKREFTLDPVNSIDKRNLKADQFGYRSLHYVVSCNDERTKLVEYKRFFELKFEIQIRSILQHAWAEIEHDLGYKGVTSIPDNFKRSFNRVAALLESADLEFDRLKKELSKYENEVESFIEIHPEEVEINLPSLKSFVFNNKIIKLIDQKISEKTRIPMIVYSDIQKIEIENIVISRLHFLDIYTIKDLELALKEHSESIIEFAYEWVNKKGQGRFDPGISIFYLCYFLVGRKNNLEFSNNYFTNFINNGIKSSEGKRLIEIYKKIKT